MAIKILRLSNFGAYAWNPITKVYEREITAGNRFLIGDTQAEIEAEVPEEGDVAIALDTSVILSSPLAGSWASYGVSYEDTANKDVADGYAGLDSSLKLDGLQQVYGHIANTACEGNDPRLGAAFKRHHGFIRSPLPNAGGSMFLESGYGYFVYLGTPLEEITLNYITLYVSTAGAGSQTAEVGLFSTPNPPNRTGQTVTRLAAVSGMTDMTAAGFHRNTTPLSYTAQAGVPLWAGIRTVMGTTRVLVRGVSYEMGQGAAFIKASAGSLTSAGPWSNSVQSHSTSSVGPDLWASFD